MKEYREAKNIFMKLSENTLRKLLIGRLKGLYSTEEYFNLTVKMIDGICNSIHTKGMKNRLFKIFVKDAILELTQKFDDLCCREHFQRLADDFCDSRNIPKVKVSLSSSSPFSSYNPEKRTINLKRYITGYKMKDLETVLIHELKHHYLVSKNKIFGYMGRVLQYPLSLLLMVGGYLFQNNYLYVAGAINWSTAWGIEAYASTHERKVFRDIVICILPWIVKFLSIYT